jgi:[ribosomal protein S5]-alanine N-acetyltransferase
MDIILETERLILRKVTPEDLNSLYEILSDPIAMKWYPQIYTREETANWISRIQLNYEQYGYCFYAVVPKESGRFAGMCGLLRQIVDEREEMEVGYMFQRKNWHQGFAAEAAIACRDYGFEHFGRTRIISMINPGNFPSQRVAQKNGMTLERELEWKGAIHGVWAIQRT